jgi:signal transduction histidine kinase
MDLWSAVGMNEPQPAKHGNPSGRYLPLKPVTDRDAVNQYARDITTIVDQQYVGAQTLGSVRLMLIELLENCFAHALVSEDLPGYTCAQAWPSGRLAQVAITDNGLGMRESLGENPELAPLLIATNSCELATERYVTSKPDRHSGYGLALARELVEQNQGNLLIISGNEAFTAGVGYTRRLDLSVPWQGTIVVLEWNTDRPLDSKAIYDEWTKAEGERNGDEPPDA